jgi:acetyl-CoA synthetase
MTFKIISENQYQEEYKLSLQDSQDFWAKKAEEFLWFRKWEEVSNCDLEKGKISWFKGGQTNLAFNCLDLNLEENVHKTAIIFEPNDPQGEVIKLSYEELHEQVCQFSNLLITRDVKVGDRVCIYMPMIPEAAVAMLACARIGAVHCVVFAGFSAKALAGRIQDSGAKMLITADLLFRGDKVLKLSDIATEALSECKIDEVVMYRRGEENTIRTTANLTIWQDEINNHSTIHKAPALEAEDPLFILYTSGSTGKPKGIMHSLGGYMIYAAYSFQNVFQYEHNDIFFCTADVGWITGHSYLLYGPLLRGATTLMFEGVPTYPTPSRFWQVIEKHRVNIFYTAPTAIRALMHKGDEFVNDFAMSSLKTLGSVGEPINQEAWQWYHEKVGKKKCAIVDTWWQTETGGILISSLAGVTQSQPTFAGLPLPGVKPILLDEDGKEILENDKIGNLCFKQSWPSMARGVWGDENKFLDTYFSRFPGYYFAGDGAFRDQFGNYRVIGRVDDVINVSGHRLGTAEIENVINMHELVSESAVIGFPHEIKGEGICAFVIVKSKSDNIEREIISLIEKEIGAIARPDKIYVTSDLPKTRSGKIMRRILKKILAKEEDLGDISTLVNPEGIEQLKNLQ